VVSPRVVIGFTIDAALAAAAVAEVAAFVAEVAAFVAEVDAAVAELEAEEADAAAAVAEAAAPLIEVVVGPIIMFWPVASRTRDAFGVITVGSVGLKVATKPSGSLTERETRDLIL
jgi:hypothetical protein